jgi:hypothetical protein
MSKTEGFAAVTDFLPRHEKLSGILPTLNRLLALQAACEQILPAPLASCRVARLDEKKLTLSAPNAAVAARIRQKLPVLRAELEKRGWHIAQIRVRVKLPAAMPAPAPPEGRPPLSPNALSALDALREYLGGQGNNPEMAQVVSRIIRENARGKT